MGTPIGPVMARGARPGHTKLSSNSRFIASRNLSILPNGPHWSYGHRTSRHHAQTRGLPIRPHRSRMKQSVYHDAPSFRHSATRMPLASDATTVLFPRGPGWHSFCCSSSQWLCWEPRTHLLPTQRHGDYQRHRYGWPCWVSKQSSGAVIGNSSPTYGSERSKG
jgi:hypothetical protein